MSADRFLRACRREPVDCTPVWFMRQAGRSLPEYRRLREHHTLLDIARDPALCAEVTLLPVAMLGVDAAILFADIMLLLGDMGVRFDLQEGVGPIIEAPIRTAADVRALRPFQPQQYVAPVLEAIGLIRRQATVPLIGFAGAPFTLASYLIEGAPTRAFHRVKELMYGAPDVWAELMGRLTEATLQYLQAQIAAGVQAVQVFDSWVGCLSPADYRESIQPHMHRLFDGLRPTGVPSIHFGTGTAGLLPLMAEAGGDVIGVDWRVRLDEAWASVGNGRGIQGNLDPAVLLGPFELVERRALEVLAQAGGRSGHIFNLGHGVLPATPVDHLRRLVECVHDRTARPLSADRPRD